ncbi:MAG TPA: regulatory protein RecX [Casimicrobiaceae bacterium]|nr:regulatory protein RecX [Casimicrobiaceae bacterium]
MLARRDHARAELERRLVERGFGAVEVASALDDLERRGYLSDARVAADIVERHRERSGRYAIEALLRRKGVAASARTDALATLAGRDEFDDACRLWSKRFGEAPADERERARQYRFLLARGYTVETIARVLRAAAERD